MNRLAPHRVDALIARFEAGLSARAAARSAGVSREAAGRYHRAWRSRRPLAGAVIAPLDPATRDALTRQAVLREEAPSALAARILAAVLDGGLTEAVLG